MFYLNHLALLVVEIEGEGGDYHWFVTGLLLTWLAKLFLHPRPATSWSEVVSHAAIGSLSFAWLVGSGRLNPAAGIATAAAVGAGLGLIVLALGGAAAIRRSEGDRLRVEPAEG